jgi:cell division protein FtsZ
MVKRIKKKVKKVPLPEIEKIKKIKIKVVGIGGGGGNIVSELGLRIKRASFLTADTDSKALRGISKRVTPFLFGQNMIYGLGTGMDSGLGEMAAENEKEKIKKLLKGHDLVIFVACLGGGTGSGAMPLFAKISKNLGNLNYGIFTLPFKFEGEKKMEIARDCLEKVKPFLNIFSLIPNEKIFQVVEKNTPLPKALSTLNKILSDGLEGLLEIIYEPGLINIDFADLKTILKGRGKLAFLSTVQIQKNEESLNELIQRAINCPLYDYGIKEAKGILLNIAGERDLSLGEVNQISKVVSEMANREAKIIFGISQGSRYHNILKTTLLASDCKMKTEVPIKKSLPKKIKKIKISGRPRISEKKEEKEVRKNALQVKEEAQKLEKELLEKEKFWEAPAFLRKKKPLK